MAAGSRREVTVEDAEGSSTFLRSPPDSGGVGSSIGPGERAQRPDAGFIRVGWESFQVPELGPTHSPDHCCHPHAGGFEEVLN